MSAEEYFQGPGSDEWLWDPCDWTPNSCNDDQVYEPKHLVKTANVFVKLPPEYFKILETPKARLFSKDNGQKFWVPQSCCKWCNHQWWVLDSFMPEDKPLFTAMCPYCGENNCDCGKDA